MILKKCVTLQFCAKLLCTELVETYKKIKKWNDNYVKNEYINCKKAKNPSNKYSLSGIDVI